jgi:hypothetical protein
MRRSLLPGAVFVLAALVFPVVAPAQSGHFIAAGGNASSCRDIGVQVACSGKVAGLGGTTFEITVTAHGIADVECLNPAGNRAPGQDTVVTVSGGSGPLATPRNGQYRFSLASAIPVVPSTPTCPNRQWTARVVDVAFTTATLTLFEDGVISDQVTVTVS